MDKQKILSRLDVESFYTREVPTIKWNGKAEGLGLCPFHDDHDPSFSANRETGQFHCFGCGKKGSAFDFYMAQHGVDFKQACDALARDAEVSIPEKIPPRKGGKIVAEYNYADEKGKLLFQSVRIEPGPNGKKKTFRQRRPDGKGGWIWSLDEVQLVPYNLPEVLKAKSVLIVEGEKDVETLRAWDLTTTTNAQGAGKWRQEYSDHLKGKRVVILPDNDDPGREHAQNVAQNLHGTAESLKVVELPGLPHKGDVSDWIKQGGTKERLLELIKQAPEWSPPAKVQDKQEQFKEDEPTATPHLVNISSVTPQPITWLWRNWLPCGKIAILDGDPGLGKSTFMLDLTARITRGLPMPWETERHAAGNVILLSAEDGLADTIHPRLTAAGADLGRVDAFTGVTRNGTFDLPSIPGDIRILHQVAKEKSVRLIVIDPLMAYLNGSIKSHNDQDVRGVLHHVAKMAEDTGAAVVIVRHLNKTVGSNPLYRGGGSIGIIGAARIGLVVAQDPQNDDRRILAVAKSNLGPRPQSLAYHLEPIGNYTRVAWDGTSHLNAKDLLAVQCDDSNELGGEREAAEDFLRTLLAGGPVSANQAKKDAKAAGISEATLRRASKRLGVRHGKAGGYFGGDKGWTWSLPTEDAHTTPEDVDDAHTLGVSTFRGSEHLQQNPVEVLEVVE